jgi:osmotically-inducible protein OsmY
MRRDNELQRDIHDELKWTPSINDAEIGVAVKDGVVTLTGYVESWAQKYAAERVVERLAGVRAYADDLKVQVPSDFRRTDTEIAHAAADALAWNVELPAGTVKAKVEDGWVWLEGSVEWQFQKDAAARAICYLKGVHGVTNTITVKPKAAASYEVSRKIKDALRRNAEHDADRITVDAKDGKVTLKGTVRSWAERQDAEHAAWSAPGVREVDDRLVISL